MSQVNERRKLIFMRCCGCGQQPQGLPNFLSTTDSPAPVNAVVVRLRACCHTWSTRTLLRCWRTCRSRTPTPWKGATLSSTSSPQWGAKANVPRLTFQLFQLLLLLMLLLLLLPTRQCLRCRRWAGSLLMMLLLMMLMVFLLPTVQHCAGPANPSALSQRASCSSSWQTWHPAGVCDRGLCALLHATTTETTATTTTTSTVAGTATLLLLQAMSDHFELHVELVVKPQWQLHRRPAVAAAVSDVFAQTGR
jgi:hypothetical protein